jgi:hypothetical protein
MLVRKTMATDSPAPHAQLRRVVIALAGAEFAALLLMMALFASSLSSSEALSRNIAQAAMVLAAIPLVALVLPALVLGLKGRALRTALVLVLIALPVAAACFFFA